MWFKKALIWLKAYWYIPIALIAVGVLLLFRASGSADKVLEIVNKSQTKQREASARIDRETEERRIKVRKAYKAIVAEIEQKHQKAIDDLDVSYKKRAVDLAALYDKNPSKAAKELAKEFGLTLVEKD